MEWLIAIGQLVFQGAIVFFLRKDRLLHYFGQLMTISLIGSLLLLPVILLDSLFISLPSAVYLSYFTIPVAIMLWQHIRRIKILELPSFLTITWIGYRLLLLAIFYLYALKS